MESRIEDVAMCEVCGELEASWAGAGALRHIHRQTTGHEVRLLPAGEAYGAEDHDLGRWEWEGGA